MGLAATCGPNYISTFFIETNTKHFKNISDIQDLADGNFSQKGNFSPMHRSH